MLWKVGQRDLKAKIVTKREHARKTYLLLKVCLSQSELGFWDSYDDACLGDFGGKI